jgi:hypothetical protein
MRGKPAQRSDGVATAPGETCGQLSSARMNEVCAALWVAIQTSYWERSVCFRISRPPHSTSKRGLSGPWVRTLGVGYYPNETALALVQQTESFFGHPANNGKKSLLNRTINTANKFTITNGIAKIPEVGSLIPEGSWARAGVDAVGGGNAISGLLATGQTLFGSSASGSALAQTGAGIVLDPSMGLGPALEAGGINVPSALGALTDTVAEGASGLGLIK